MTILNTAIEATGDFKTPLISLILVAVIKVGVSYFLRSEKGMGIFGIPIGNIVSYFVGLLIAVIRMKSLRVKQAYFSMTMRFCIISVISTIASHALIYYVLPIPLTGFSFLISIVISAMIYVLVNLVFDKRIFFEFKTVILDKKRKINLSNKTNMSIN